MTDDLTLPGHDGARTIWVFTADLDPAAFKAFARPGETWPLAEALGLAGLSPASVETFLTSDLEDYGLERYLTEAHGMDPASVAPDAARLAALDGPVVLLFSRDLPEGADRIDPDLPLAFIGRYAAPYSLAPAAPHLPSDSTRGHLAGPAGPVSDSRSIQRLLLITLGALIALALLVLVLA
ncbi:MAG: hypothetical protein KDK28_06325 [Maritimibacter sp.]|nr:hypothetical protein [Maritimibacter sp.]